MTQVEMVAVEKLIQHPRNPRSGDVDAIRASIRENGFNQPLIVQASTKYVLVGNHRLIAATLEGYERVPVQWADIDDEAALRMMLADNRTGDLAHYDDRALLDILKEQQASDTGLAGSLFLDTDVDKLESFLRDREAAMTAINATETLDGMVQLVLGKYEFLVAKPDFDRWLSGVLEEAESDIGQVAKVVLERLGVHAN